MRIFDPVAGGEALIRINVRLDVSALAFFTDPTTGAPRVACGTVESVANTRSCDVRVFDAVAGGDPLPPGAAQALRVETRAA